MWAKLVNAASFNYFAHDLLHGSFSIWTTPTSCPTSVTRNSAKNYSKPSSPTLPVKSYTPTTFLFSMKSANKRADGPINRPAQSGAPTQPTNPSSDTSRLKPWNSNLRKQSSFASGGNAAFPAPKYAKSGLNFSSPPG
ncbi:predicted protein [Plenodomus lingam JN3]|uniref:Predicted protein n=1 Tax=Leptosphaeria maculans (strain JN3 / isolate v23.1.3 / race Av1-4-5-6-7-8) TaxID=985895 RepID=E4ZRU6_LEPMJ|nr:predicted protein [Plenodomus lingam JN3]CBX93943.1 predicted protein [Plenodomus lingam JN3]